MKTSILKFIVLFWLIGSLCLAGSAFVKTALADQDLGAQNVGDIINRLDQTAKDSKIIESPGKAPTVYNYVGRFINIFLGFLGVIFLIIVMYSGFNWMMAKGNTQAVEEAVKHIENAAIGLIIVILSYIFVNFLVFKIMGIGTGAPLTP